jgi:hypothetical protein
LEINIKDAFLLMAFDEIPAEYDMKEISIKSLRKTGKMPRL